MGQYKKIEVVEAAAAVLVVLITVCDLCGQLALLSAAAEDQLSTGVWRRHLHCTSVSRRIISRETYPTHC